MKGVRTPAARRISNAIARAAFPSVVLTIFLAGALVTACGTGSAPESPTPTVRPAGRQSTPVSGNAAASALLSTFPGSQSSLEGAVPPIMAAVELPTAEQLAGKFVLPVADWTAVLDVFNEQRRGDLVHGGVDIGLAGRASSPVRAVCRGAIASVTSNDSYGLNVVVDCGDGWTVILGFLGTTTVSAGDPVNADTFIGLSDPAGGHLHFEMRYRDIPVDPRQVVDLPDTPRPPDTPTPPPATLSPTLIPAPGTPVPVSSTTSPTVTPSSTPTPGPPTATATRTATPTWTPTPRPTPRPRPTATPTLPILR